MNSQSEPTSSNKKMDIIPTTIKNPELVQDRRKQIILAAIKLFAEKGFYKATIKELSKEAGISQGNIYGYISTKEDIFFLIHNFMADLADEMLGKIINSVDIPLNKLQQMIRVEFNLMYEWADAILLLYQESHILQKIFLKKLLRRERDHISKFEIVLKECIENGDLRECNVRVMANLVKIMIDSWILKRWDLKGSITSLEMERTIIHLLFEGLLKEKEIRKYSHNGEEFKGKSALIFNGDTTFANEISSFLISLGARVVIQQGDIVEGGKIQLYSPSNAGSSKSYTIPSFAEIGSSLFEMVIKDFWPLDILIQDLGARNKNEATLSKELEDNFSFAKRLVPSIKREMMRRGVGRIVYLTPCAWDKQVDPVQYEIVKTGAIALTKALAKEMAISKVNVHCVIPGFIGAVPPFVGKENVVDVYQKIIASGEGEIADILNAVHFLISDASKYLSGQVLEVTRGMEL